MKKSQYSRTKRAPKKSSLKTIIFAGLFFCLLGAVAYFLIWSPWLWVKRIEIAGSKKVAALEIEKVVQENLDKKFWQIIPQKSIILISHSKIGKEILERFPEIRQVNIIRQMSDVTARAGLALAVKVIERQSIGIWCKIEQETATSSPPVILTSEVDKCFYIDQEGVIYREVPLISGNLVLNIYSAQDESVSLREQVTSPEIIDFILALRKELPQIKTATGLWLKTDSFEIVSSEDVRAEISQGWQIYFNPAYSVNSQLKALSMVLEEEIKEAVSSLKYIDLRIEGRVYYR
jgi:hypothetical protein